MGSIHIWAWGVSIFVHFFLLAGLTLVKFSPEKQKPAIARTPATRITRIKEAMHSSCVIPKPKIKRPFTQPCLLSPAQLSIPNIPPDRTADDLACLAVKSSDSSSRLPYSKISPEETEFFGCPLGARKICFVVDCSGSMHGMFQRVAERLKNVIMSLEPDHYFYIILFRDRLIENGNGQLVRATGRAKLEARDFVDGVTPEGRTNAIAALERAMKIQDNHGCKPAVIFFLTDGFELLPEDNILLPQRLAAMRKRLSPETKINTIGFWTKPIDCAILRAIALESGGEFSYVEP